LRIIHRPEEIEGRLVPGHWEGDLIKCAFNRSAVGTVAERKTRYLVLSKMRGCTVEAALEGFTRQMNQRPRKTLGWNTLERTHGRRTCSRQIKRCT
jgi:IS30 family transposase